MRRLFAVFSALAVLTVAPQALAADPAAGLKPGQTFKDCPDCPEMVVLPAGQFMMGSTAEEREREGVPPLFGDREEPMTKITVAKPFAVAKTETTRGLYARFVEATKRPIEDNCGGYNKATETFGGLRGFSWRNPGFEQTDDHPAVCLSYRDSLDFIAWLSAKTGKTYRLASEAEWEYAVRGGTTTPYYWGQSVIPACEKANILTSATMTALGNPESRLDRLVCASDKAFTVPVGSYEANPFGLSDMIGGVWEWVSDCANPTLKGIPTDASPRKDGDCTRRIVRGGAFHSQPWLTRSATRGGGQLETLRPVAAGFRVVRDIS